MKRHNQSKGNFIERFASSVDGFNVRELRLLDLDRICEKLGIEVIPKQMRRLHGSAYEIDGFRFIYLNPLISYPEQIIAGFHELFHIFNHIGNDELCTSYGDALSYNKKEFQAQAIGVIALMPLSVVYQMNREEMMREFEISRKLAEFRFNIFQEYRR